MTLLGQRIDATAVDPMNEVRHRWPTEAFAPSADRVVTVAQIEEPLAGGKLRHELFVSSDSKSYEHVDHEAPCFLEPIGHLSISFSCASSIGLALRARRRGSFGVSVYLAQMIPRIGVTRPGGEGQASQIIVNRRRGPAPHSFYLDATFRPFINRLYPLKSRNRRLLSLLRRRIARIHWQRNALFASLACCKACASLTELSDSTRHFRWRA